MPNPSPATTPVLEILGRLQVRSREGHIDLGPPRQQSVFAIIALFIDEPVATDKIIECVWAGSPPAYAANLVHKYISGLRRILADSRPAWPLNIERDADGYTLRAGGRRDVDLFRELVDGARDAREQGRVSDASALLSRALHLWRGELLSGIDAQVVEDERRLVADQRLSAVLEYTELRLELGDPGDAVGLLERELRDHRFDERLHRLRILALHGSGRTAAAVAAFRELESTLRDELGVGPGPESLEAYERIRNGTGPSALERPGRAGPAAPGPASPPRPAQLPPEVRGFTGREQELAVLESVLAPDGAGLPIVSVYGPAGIGKTALALHWAHRRSDLFPDGQLYVNLADSGDGGTPAPECVLPGLLRALGRHPQQVPQDLAEQTLLYRSLLAGRRVLVVVEGASSSAQVRPLLPGSTGCGVIVTGHHHLAGLTTRDGARPLRLAPLNDRDSRALLTAELGRATPSGPRLEALLRLCGGIPLALRIAAAKADSSAIGDLADALGRTDPADEEQTARAESVDLPLLSYWLLSPEAQRMVTLMCVVPAVEFSVHSAAAIAGIAPADAAAALDELASVNLLEERKRGYYRTHTALRSRLSAAMPDRIAPAACREGLYRLLAFQVAAVRKAAGLYHCGSLSLPGAPEPADPAPPDPPFRTFEQAMAWMSAERLNLFETLRFTAEHVPGRPVWELVGILCWFCWVPDAGVDRLAAASLVEAADRHGDPAARLVTRLLAGGRSGYLGEPRAALVHYDEALGLRDGLTWPAGIAEARAQRGHVLWVCGRLAEAEQDLRAAIAIRLRLGTRQEEAVARLWLVRVLVDQGRPGAAEEEAETCLALFADAGHSPVREALTRLHLAEIALNRGDGCLARRRAQSAQRALRDRSPQVRSLAHATTSLIAAQEHDRAAADEHARLAGEGGRNGDLRILAETRNLLGEARLVLGEDEAALGEFRAAHRCAAHAGFRRGELTALTGVAEIHRRLGHDEWALDGCGRVLAMAGEEYPAARGRALAVRARLHAAAGSRGASDRDRGAAERLFAQAGYRRSAWRRSAGPVCVPSLRGD
ncbi:AfsR/SARP family transcriptional regulator [Streptomonospora wellingtoniae]|uniref:BTAD domain-containing putative transcriptional regulator n=1 Tax=Streptomonospora wellingtoniae TaxID=3075544 RepID=A0ABU2KTE6_9ACTN|nr:BTAD domain-containing putative transcriptional regulator [Streptomonospora sp. DSM 45055]MDT0302378.1 BTAD domain-containing putative transcriptional regulator [Streptomonospora sp. DSM 45055]